MEIFDGLKILDYVFYVRSVNRNVIIKKKKFLNICVVYGYYNLYRRVKGFNLFFNIVIFY